MVWVARYGAPVLKCPLPHQRNQEIEMQVMSGYIQDQLDEVWKAIGTDKEQPGTQRVVDDVVEVMAINLPLPPGGQLVVARRKGAKVWHELPYVGQENEFV